MPNIALGDIKYKQLFINNEFVDAVSGKTFNTLNPSTEEVIAKIAEGDKEDINKAVEAAKNAFHRTSKWRTMDASARGCLINKLADLIERDVEHLAALESMDNGKPYSNSVMEIHYVVRIFRYYAGHCDKIHGKTIPTDGGNFTVTKKEPVGVVGQIIPWNYPMLMVAWKLGPALATGCTVVLKPAEQTPLTALYTAALTKEAGFPDGVINVIPGYGPTAGAALALHNDVQKVAFTGSTEIGKKIMEYAGQSNLKKVSLELGGKSPIIIMDDVDVDEAVEIAYNALFPNAGQSCCAGTRTFVHASIYRQFVEKAVQRARQRIVGDAFKDKVDQGPQIDKESLDKIIDLVESGLQQGAKLELGGHRIGSRGYFFEPTIFSSVQDDMRIAKEEIFGPVQSIFMFHNLNEAIDRANATSYGLAASILTKNIDHALLFAQSVEAGSVWVNCYSAVACQAPFGGYKQSGIGRELGEESLNEYLETKTISIKIKGI